MAANICLRCLARPAAIQASSASLKNSFSTSARLTGSLIAKIPKKSGALTGDAAKKRLAMKGRKGKQTSGSAARKDPAAMKAQRKKVVLSNINAIEVPGLQELIAGNVTRPGEILTLSNDSVDALRAIEAFKHNQGWNLFLRPSTLVTGNTIDMASIVTEVTAKRTSRHEYITGDKGSGKSVLALQAQTFAFQQGWVVIHVPEVQDLVTANTSYAPLRSGDRTFYTQPEYISDLLSRISKSSPGLSKLTLSQKHALPIPLAPDTTLSRLCDIGAGDPSISHPIFTALLTELLTPSTEAAPRPPILFSMDGYPHVARNTAYLDAKERLIHGFDLHLVHTFHQLLRGATPLPNGGLVLAIDSGSNRPGVPVLDRLLETKLRDQAGAAAAAAAARRDGSEWASRPSFIDPYAVTDPRIPDDALQGVHVRKLEGISREETRGLMEYYARSGIMRGKVDERAVSEAWTLGGGGTVGEVEGVVARLRVL